MTKDLTAVPDPGTVQPGDAPGHPGDLAAARRVLRLASDALVQMSAELNGDFTRAVDAVFATEGRVIVSGMGKSGLVARKIAATLASTGTPALFVHPAEASHGDLGMIARGDTLLMLSNSGENQELGDLIAHAKRTAMPLIAITGANTSTLATAADIALILPKAEEACPMGMAPTTSSTMMISLGDALAVALMERRGFTKDKYFELHPGGRLGQQLMRVEAIMHPREDVPLVTPETPVADAVRVMSAHRFGCTGVTDADGRLIGVITDGDLRRHLSPDLVTRTAGDIMTPNPRTIPVTAFAVEAVQRMNDIAPAITCLFVVEDGDSDKPVPVGILHMHDCLRAGIT